MRWSLGTSHSPAWTKLLLTGTLLTFSTCSASLELPSSVSLDPLTEGADAHLPVPRSLDGILSTSWFRGHEVRPEAMIFSAEGLPGPGHTGRETLDTQGSLIIRNVTTLDAGSYTVVMETSGGRRSATEQIQVKATYDGVQLVTFPGNKQGVLRSELNYSVILQWAALITPEPVLRWTFNGRPRGTGERLIVHRLSMKDLGTYLCLAENSQGVYLSQPVTIMLPQADVEPTEPAPISRNPPLSLSGGSAIALVVAASVVGLVLVGSVLLTVIQKLRPLLTSSRRNQPCPISWDLGDEVMSTSMPVLTVPVGRGSLQKRGVWTEKHRKKACQTHQGPREIPHRFAVKFLDPEPLSSS